MASVEELLAKYGKTEPQNVSNPLDDFPQKEPSEITSVGTSFRLSGEELSKNTEPSPFDVPTPDTEDVPYQGREQTATNSDGRRLVAADAYYSEDSQTNKPSKQETSTSTVSGFNFEDEEDDFDFPRASDRNKQHSVSTEPNSVRYEEFHGKELETDEKTSEPQATFTESDSNSPANDTYPGDTTGHESNNVQYPQVYMDPSSLSLESQQPSTSVEHQSVQPTTEPSQNASLESLASQLTVLMPAPAETHAGLTAFSTFMFPPFGAVAVHHAMRTFTTAYNGEKEESASHSSKALAWSIAAIIAGVFLVALFGAYTHDPTLFDSLFNKLGVLNN